MKKFDQEILLTAMDVVGRLCETSIECDQIIKNYSFQFPKMTDRVTTSAEFNKYVEEVIVPGLYDNVMSRFAILSKKYIEDTVYNASIPAKEVTKIKGIFNAKIDDIAAELLNMNSTDLKYYNCDLDWLENTDDKLSCSFYLRSSLNTCVVTIFKDILEIINKKNIEKGLTGSNMILDKPSKSKQPIISDEKRNDIFRSFNSDVIKDKISDLAAVINITEPKKEEVKKEEIKTMEVKKEEPKKEEVKKEEVKEIIIPDLSQIITPPPAVNLQFPTPSDIAELITKPGPAVEFEAPLVNPQYDDLRINKYIFINEAQLISRNDLELFKESLLTATDGIEEYDKIMNFDKPSVFGIAYYADVRNYTLLKMRKIGKKLLFLNPDDKGYVQIVVEDGEFICYIKDENNQLNQLVTV